MSSHDPSPSAKVSMLIRRPVAEVFNAFVDPRILKQFWLSDASGRLEVGKRVRWDFMVKGASVETYVKELKQDEHILIEWSDGSTVAWTFTSRDDDGTVVEIENSGFQGDPKAVVETALESTQGFAIVLCDLKTLLEHHESMNLVRDKASLIEAKHVARS